MANQRRRSRTRPLKDRTDQELADGLLELEFAIPTLKQCENRRDALWRRAEQLGDASGTGKRCSPHHRCGSLGCPICRRRAQLAVIVQYAPYFQPLFSNGGGK